jgi:hypothetical protein
MNKSKRIVNRFEHWSVEDCSCEYCVHYTGKDGSCSLEVCCCADIREEAIRREQGATGGSRARKEAAPCPV